MSRFSSSGGGGRPPRPGGDRGPRPEGGSSSKPLFDPGKALADLVDPLAEQQAKLMPSGRDELKSSQLRRFFGDVKDLYRQWEQGADYKTSVEPRFKMMRSKASYAWRNGDQKKIPREFYEFIDNGVAKVTSAEQFKAFVQHFEAVVGFLYGLGKVGKS